MDIRRLFQSNQNSNQFRSPTTSPSVEINVKDPKNHEELVSVAIRCFNRRLEDLNAPHVLADAIEQFQKNYTIESDTGNKSQVNLYVNSKAAFERNTKPHIMDPKLINNKSILSDTSLNMGSSDVNNSNYRRYTDQFLAL